MVPVYQALLREPWCVPRILLTGQHRTMARNVLELFGVAPDLDMDVMEPNQDLVSLAARLTHGFANLLSGDRPDVILVQGDTTSAMVGGLMGFYAGCRVGHIEAGLRTKNLSSPYPEEFNRRVVALTAHWHFAPTSAAAGNLHQEGIREHVHIVGNTVIDAALEMATRQTSGMKSLRKRFPFLEEPGSRTVLVTSHRRENFGSPMQNIADAVARLSRAHIDVQFIVPVHPNPLVGHALKPSLGERQNVHLIDPVEYDEMVCLLRNAWLVLTDSGGIQEEAPAFGVPVLVMRNETERMEGVVAGCSQLVGTNADDIFHAADQLLSDTGRHARMAKVSNPYGDGNSSGRIAQILGDAR